MVNVYDKKKKTLRHPTFIPFNLHEFTSRLIIEIMIIIKKKVIGIQINKNNFSNKIRMVLRCYMSDR